MTSANQGEGFPQKHTPKSGEFLLWLLPCSANIWSAVDFGVQLIQKKPQELLCILLTGLITDIHLFIYKSQYLKAECFCLTLC